ncbi:branched-chain amino acid transporter permease [Gordonia sp. (in: high G+C Gram-positive bacteria)]|uniref:branched-chain amino acid transporter permease n=1 Tax=Gordonia sp. (in: high G+C Gram-positive bacteria) TaxID=84139 RepID=UPI003529598D
MPETGYLIAVLATVFAITFALRALPFAVLGRLRQSRFVLTLAAWMPAGILAILAATTFSSSIDDAGRVLPAVLALAVTVGVHLGAGRRTLLSVGLGTLTYIALLAVL